METTMTAPAETSEHGLAACAVCGNRYDKTFALTTHDGRTLTFDSFECAIHLLAPSCAHCGCRIVGHGLESEDVMFCCASCARMAGVWRVADRARVPT
jgi:hypothetical protein